MEDRNTPFIEVVYGSHLYGTSTPTSDTDKKVIYLPAVSSLLLNEKVATYKQRFDANGNVVNDNTTMPANGVETEFIPIQSFVRDFVMGQTYAIEVAYALLPKCKNSEPQPHHAFVCDLVKRFRNRDIKAMVDFAMKQTFDYVRRGERLNTATAVLHATDAVAKMALDADQANIVPRLSAPVGNGKTILDALSEMAGLPIGTIENNGKTTRTLEFNGRSYMESSWLPNFRDAVVKMISMYGDRSTQSAKTEVDYKSLSHAIRVYEQGIELLETGKIVFPRPRANYYSSVKQGLVDLDEVKKLLIRLDDDILKAIEKSELPERTPQMIAESNVWLIRQLYNFYSIKVE